jgi:hypothetical protein
MLREGQVRHVPKMDVEQSKSDLDPVQHRNVADLGGKYPMAPPEQKMLFSNELVAL